MADMDTFEEPRQYDGNDHPPPLMITQSHDRIAFYGYLRRLDVLVDVAVAMLSSLRHDLQLTARATDDRDYPPPRDRSRSPGPDRDGDSRIRDEPLNGRNDR